MLREKKEGANRNDLRSEYPQIHLQGVLLLWLT